MLFLETVCGGSAVYGMVWQSKVGWKLVSASCLLLEQLVRFARDGLRPGGFVALDLAESRQTYAFVGTISSIPRAAAIV